jgi:hypothetical protein
LKNIKNYNFMNEVDVNGLSVIKGLLSQEEVQNFRDTILREEKNFTKDTLDENREFYAHLIFKKNFIKKILLNPQIIKYVKDILGDDICFFGDSSLNKREGDKYTNTGNFHVDSKSDDDDPATTEYKILRVGVYLQDTKNYSGGLKIRWGSHKHICFKGGVRSILYSIKKLLNGQRTLSSFKLGKMHNLEILPGDVAFWNLRLHHCGNSKRNRFFPDICLHPFLDRNLPKSMFLPLEKRRLVFFSMFGVPSKELNNYLANRLDGNRNFSFWKNLGITYTEAASLFKERGVQLIDIDNFKSL